MRHLKLLFPFLMAVLLAIKLYTADTVKASISLLLKAALGKVKFFKNLVYAEVQGHSLLLDLFMPRNEKEKLPLIVWIHGGGWISGDKENCPIRKSDSG